MPASTREVVTELFDRLEAGRLDTVGELFAEQVDWDIPGATELVPWIGRRRTRAEAAEFYAGFTGYIDREVFEVERILVDGEEAVVLGHLRSIVRATGKVIETAFAYRLTVHNGQITRYFMFEDSWRVAEAAR
ncbi:nuclear transport factor 2 family protein [Amycolatopsis nigrescens]|uniref:nuclear transport factor 2 family protein n=1 Tax=Amycolatopsis nigrescens TaxID=381445 RepID=UPI000370DC00|nr:nuclear transport factor 2 family protein [Amycolatopsis nigrescens]